MKRWIAIASVCLGWLVVGGVLFRHWYGWDLGAHYVAATLVRHGLDAHIYDHDPTDFSRVDSVAWSRVIEAAELPDAPPYVHPPGLVHLLAPFVPYGFEAWSGSIFWANLVSIAAAVVMLLAALAPALLRARVVAVLLFAALATTPLQHALGLGQTTPLILATVAASLLLAARRRWLWAGLVLAPAAFVKVSPGLLAVLGLRRRAWLFPVGCGAAIVGLSIASAGVAGTEVTREYYERMRDISGTTLVAFNNQSAEGAFERASAPVAEWRRWTPWPRRLVWRWLSLALLLASCGWAWHRSRSDLGIGAAVVVLASLLFAPITWSHYFLFLLIPAVVVMGRSAGKRSQHSANVGLALAWLLTTPLMVWDPRSLVVGLRWHASLLAAALVLAVMVAVIARGAVTERRAAQ